MDAPKGVIDSSRGSTSVIVMKKTLAEKLRHLAKCLEVLANRVESSDIEMTGDITKSLNVTNLFNGLTSHLDNRILSAARIGLPSFLLDKLIPYFKALNVYQTYQSYYEIDSDVYSIGRELHADHPVFIKEHKVYWQETVDVEHYDYIWDKDKDDSVYQKVRVSQELVQYEGQIEHVRYISSSGMTPIVLVRGIQRSTYINRDNTVVLEAYKTNSVHLIPIEKLHTIPVGPK